MLKKLLIKSPENIMLSHSGLTNGHEKIYQHDLSFSSNQSQYSCVNSRYFSIKNPNEILRYITSKHFSPIN